MDSAENRTVCYVVSNELVKVSSGLPPNLYRSLYVHSLVKAFGLLDQSANLRVLRPQTASDSELTAYHTRDYLEEVWRATSGSTPAVSSLEFGLEDDCPPFPGLQDYVRLVAGGSLTASNALRAGRGDIAIFWDGGRHHAQKSKASGFCYVADCVLAIMALRRAIPPSVPGQPSTKPRVMYLDLDLHFSDGVSHAFHASGRTTSSQVLTLSVHHAAPGFFPVSELSALPDPESASFDPFTLSIPLQQGASDATFARIWPTIERVRDAFRPDYVVLQCGADGLAGDPYAVWNWSLGSAPGSFGWCVERVCQQWPCKVLLLGGGGYNHPNVARAWTYLTSIALGRTLSLEADIPDHPAFPQYAPSFVLEIPPGHSQDKNTEAYLQNIEARFDSVIRSIEERINATA